MSTEWELHYDRRVSADFLAHFQGKRKARGHCSLLSGMAPKAVGYPLPKQ